MNTALSNVIFQNPIEDHRVTQIFGVNPDIYERFGLDGHNGVDYRCEVGSFLHSPVSGQIIDAYYSDSGYGNYIKVKYDSGVAIFAHLSAFDVNISDFIRKGEIIGVSGNTGFSTGPHLHFEVRPDSEIKDNGFNGAVDPEKWWTERTEQVFERNKINTESALDYMEDVWRKLAEIDNKVNLMNDLSFEIQELTSEVRVSHQKVSSILKS